MEESFPEIRLYYSPTKWSSMSIIVKRHLQTSKDEYDAAVKAGTLIIISGVFIKKKTSDYFSLSGTEFTLFIGHKISNALTLVDFAGLDPPLPKFMQHTRPSTSMNQVPSSSNSGKNAFSLLFCIALTSTIVYYSHSPVLCTISFFYFCRN